ncbi:MAG TPA: cytoplasmic protein [Candidatus Eisenbacteria bacterium]|nr:cytoplasmic protein [Candidatus Eisenbacteria bacterium]
MRVLLVLLVVFVSLGKVRAQDPVKTDSDKYKVVFENDRVRILEYRDKPGDKTTLHAHPDFVVVARSAFKRRLTLPGGKSATREFKPGEVVWTDAQSHIGENIGDTETDVLIIELKEPRPGRARP